VSVACEVRNDRNGGEPAAVEFTTPSLTSQNLDEKLGVDARAPEILAAEAAMVETLGHVEWCELSSHGYVIVDVDQDRARGEWWHVDTVLERCHGERMSASHEVARGATTLQSAGATLAGG
jgi:alkaline phosphatase D